MALLALTLSFLLCLSATNAGLGGRFRHVRLSISPQKVAIGEKVRFECVLPRDVTDTIRMNHGSNVSITMFRNARLVIARQEASCSNSTTEVSADSTIGRPLPPVNCSTMILDDVFPNSVALNAKYVCDVRVSVTGMEHVFSSDSVGLEVTGDPTPPVTRFGIINAATGAPVERRSEVPAGLRLSAFCESVPLKRPPPAITVSVTGGGVHGSHTPCSRLDFYVTVPREPRVSFNCSVYNGFGAQQTDEFSITAVYGPIPSETVTLQEADTSNDEEQILCSVRNNPPKRLNITGLEPDVLKSGYPRFVEKPGLSLAYVRFDAMAARTGGRLVSFLCGVEGYEPAAVGAVRLTGPDVCSNTFC